MAQALDSDDNSSTLEIIADESLHIIESDLRKLSVHIRSWLPKERTTLSTKQKGQLENLLEKLFETAQLPNLPAAHRTASFNCLCGFVEQALQSSCPEVREICLNQGLFLQLVSLYLEAASNAPVKALRQVLATLMRLTSKISSSDARGRDYPPKVLLERCMALILDIQAVSSVKPALHILEAILGTSLLDLTDLALTLKSLAPQDLREASCRVSMERFVSSLLQWVQYLDIAPLAGRSLAVFLKFCGTPSSKNLLDEAEEHVCLWSEPLRRAITRAPELIENYELYVLPELLSFNGQDTRAFLKVFPFEALARGQVGHVSETDIRMCLAILKSLHGQPLLIEHEQERNANHPELDQLSIPERICVQLLRHALPNIRTTSLSLLIYSRSSTLPLHEGILQVFRDVLPMFHTEVDAKARNEFIGLTKRLFTRIRAALNRLSHRGDTITADCKSEESSCAEEKHSSVHESHSEFMSWYFAFNFQELGPTASYQRHITALKVLQLAICTEVNAAAEIEIYSQTLHETLINLLMDPFDDVRASAASIIGHLTKMPSPLNAIIRPQKGRQLAKVLDIAIPRAGMMMQRSGRADYADGFGRLQALRFENTAALLENVQATSQLWNSLADLHADLTLAESSLIKAVSSAPIHARLIALRYILSCAPIHSCFSSDQVTPHHSWRSFLDQLFQCCARVWHAVKPVLCQDSPEGHNYQDLEDEDSDLGIKDTLSFSWRALKESSLLMQTCVTSQDHGKSGDGMLLQHSDYLLMGNLAFEQLAQLRHRGAFSTVSRTFATCCSQCARSSDPTIRDLPRKWYLEALLCLEEKVSSTRRSAGLPSLMTGILTADPGGPLLGAAIKELQRIAISPIEPLIDVQKPQVPQVHAMNCLKDIFTNTRLGNETEKYVSSTLVIAVDRLQNRSWAIRNCGLMLLKALLTRMGGGTTATTENRMTLIQHQHTHEKYPDLSVLTIQLLQESYNIANIDSGTSSANHARSMEVAYPALEIIDRVGMTQGQHAFTKTLIETLLGSPVWHLREKAARTLVGLIPKDEMRDSVQRSIRSLNRDHNRRHGDLLLAKYLLQHTSFVVNDSSILQALSDEFERHVYHTTCGVIVTAYLNVMRVVFESQEAGSGASSCVDDIFKKALKYGSPPLLARFPGKDLVSGLLLYCHLLQSSPFSNDNRQASDESRGNTDSLFATDGSGILLSELEDESLLCKLLSRLPSPKLLRLARLFYSRKQFLGLSTASFQSALLNQLAINSSTFNHSSMTAEDPMDWSTLRVLFDESFLVREPGNDSIETRNARLKVQGALLARLHMSTSEEQDYKQGLQVWTRSLKLAVHVQAETSTRLAAATSIKYWSECLCGLQLSEDQLGVLFALYDLLVDDDEEVRDCGAATVSRLLSSKQRSPGPPDLPLSHPASVVSLLRFLESYYGGTMSLFQEAIRRTFGLRSLAIASVSNLPVTKVSLEQALNWDTSLFVEEKQNLYIDEAQEAERWANVLALCLNIAATSWISSLGQWTLDSLDTLTQHARAEADGPLGWSSIGDVFLLGMRTFCVAEVLFKWRRRSIAVPATALKVKLEDLLSAQTGSLNGLWLRKIRVVIALHES